MSIRTIGSGEARGPTPPGPRLPSPVQTAIFTWKRQRWANSLREKYGDVVALKVFPWGSVILVFTADHIGAMFGSPPSRFHAGEGNRVLAPVFGEHALITADGDEHRRLRKTLAPLFGRAAVRGHQGAVRELTERELERWPVGRPFKSLDRCRVLILDIIWRVIFGPDEGPDAARLRGIVRRLPVVDLLILMGLNSPQARRFGPWRRTARLLGRMDELIYETIERRRTAPDLERRTDVLSRLVSLDGAERLSPVEIRDQLVTLLFAGHEPTATALAWTLHELARNPRVAKHAARAALLDDSAYLEAVVKESLRRRPAIFESIWTLAEDVELAGLRLPKGATVMPMLGVVHLDPANYRAPDEFRPERFLEDDIPPHAFIPFGGGARRCIGAHLALMQATEVLRVLLSKRVITTDRQKPEEEVARNVTVLPGDGARIIVRPLSDIEQEIPRPESRAG
ncbi:putative cytochrome P450 135A1 [Streptomyces inusitatus]|uniref:Cytochrome P450 135A1 n=1 Tax=Streptomyces inusitatus TaxID=68221 RepID=A0A918PWH0_9ACTN|nr:cytochrome P450 [Streptomyces inusitatus]GGZ24444.1 putative cytochrome P450 135A1 [Streptomyces inusitatus]